MAKTPSEQMRANEVAAAREFLHACMFEFSDKKIIWLAEKASKISSYDRSKKSYPAGYYKFS